MDDNPDELRKQIDQTKASLVGKLEALETQVAGTVQEASETVAETVTAVKDTVETVVEKVHSAGEFFNLKAQTQQRPWVVFGGSVLLGCMATYLLSGKSKDNRQNRRSEERDYPEPQRTSASVASVPGSDYPQTHAEPKEEKKHSWLWEQAAGLMGLAVGSAMGVVRDLATQGLPEALGRDLAKELDQLTTHLGGKPIEGSLIRPEKDQPATKQPAA